MSWARFDDGFDTNRKILALRTDTRRWTWLRVLLYTFRNDSDIVPDEIAEAVPKATRPFLRDCIAIGLVDIDQDGLMRVHDWLLYSNASLEEKVAYYLERNPHATANEVAREVGGTRQIVLNEVRRIREISEKQASQNMCLNKALTTSTEQSATSGQPEETPEPSENDGTAEPAPAVRKPVREVVLTRARPDPTRPVEDLSVEKTPSAPAPEPSRANEPRSGAGQGQELDHIGGETASLLHRLKEAANG